MSGLRPVSVLLAIAPFLPGAWHLAQRGVPDTLLTGDAATLELRVRHAADFAQWLGPYSHFGWSHPGPLYFYLVLPFYSALGERGPALSVFAFVVNLAAVLGMVVLASRLFGALTGLMLAALVAVFALVGAPFLLSNEWNPILPILPFACLTFLAVSVAVGQRGALPVLAAVASFIVQTHLAFVPVVAVTLIGAFVSGRRRFERATLVATGLVLLVCWALPLLDAVTAEQGNVQQLVAFFAPGNLAEHSWREGLSAVVGQLAVMPVAVMRTMRLSIAPDGRIAVTLGVGMIVVVCGAFVWAWRQRDEPLRMFAALVVAQCLAAVFAVRAIRGEVLFHLIAWIAVSGFLAMSTGVAWALRAASASVSSGLTAAAAAVTIVLLALAMTEPVPRGPMFPPADDTVARVAQEVETYLRGTRFRRPTIEIRSQDAWPAAVGIVLHLHKQRIPVAVARDWLFLVGEPFEGGRNPMESGRLFVGDAAFAAQAPLDQWKLVANTEKVYVFAEELIP